MYHEFWDAYEKDLGNLLEMVLRNLKHMRHQFESKKEIILEDEEKSIRL